jgi:hypothetical protein
MHGEIPAMMPATKPMKSRPTTFPLVELREPTSSAVSDYAGHFVRQSRSR